jgi:hypothetical protein
MLAGSAAAAPAARQVASETAGILSHRLYDDGVTRPEPTDDRDAARQRAEELANAAANPNQIAATVRANLHDVTDPGVIAAATSVFQRKLLYLASKAPSAPPPTVMGGKDWKPSASETQSFARRVRAAEDPSSVLEDLEKGVATPEAADTLREVYPRLYQEAQLRLLEKSADLQSKLPYQRVLKLGQLFDAPLVESLLPERIAALQAAGAIQVSGDGTMGSSPPPAGLSRPPNLDSLYMTASDRRAMKR